jgi:ATP adenylyltransferase
MDRLFSPWRYAYVADLRREDAGCVLCRLGSSSPAEDESSRVVGRFEHHYIVLNAFPYNSGHLMVVPYRHEPLLSRLRPEELHELAHLAARVETVLRDEYRAEGINLGMNLGSCAGAGIEGHLHLHLVPRWSGDTNFMTVTGETRVLPEDLAATWSRLRGRV